jgi:hypothetical protein
MRISPALLSRIRKGFMLHADTEKLTPRSATACAAINHEAESRYASLALEPPARSPRCTGLE